VPPPPPGAGAGMPAGHPTGIFLSISSIDFGIQSGIPGMLAVFSLISFNKSEDVFHALSSSAIISLTFCGQFFFRNSISLSGSSRSHFAVSISLYPPYQTAPATAVMANILAVANPGINDIP
jgi:hypothetical protein